MNKPNITERKKSKILFNIRTFKWFYSVCTLTLFISMNINFAYSNIIKEIEGQVAVEDGTDDDINDLVVNCSGSSYWPSTTTIQKFDISCRALAAGACNINKWAVNMPCKGKIRIDIGANNITNQQNVSSGTKVKIVDSFNRDMFKNGEICKFQEDFLYGKFVNITVICEETSSGSGDDYYNAPTIDSVPYFSFADIFAVDPLSDGIWLTTSSTNLSMLVKNDIKSFDEQIYNFYKSFLEMAIIPMAQAATNFSINRFVEGPIHGVISQERGNYLDSMGLNINTTIQEACDPNHNNYKGSKECIDLIRQETSVPNTAANATTYCNNLKAKQDSGKVKTAFSLNTCGAGNISDKFEPSSYDMKLMGIPKVPCQDANCSERYETNGGLITQKSEVFDSNFEIRTIVSTTQFTAAACSSSWNQRYPHTANFNGTNYYSCCGRAEEGWSLQCDDETGSVECFCQMQMNSGGGGGGGSPQVTHVAHSPYATGVQFDIGNWLNSTNSPKTETMKATVITPLLNPDKSTFIGSNQHIANDLAYITVFQKVVTKGSTCTAAMPQDATLISNRWNESYSNHCSDSNYYNENDCIAAQKEWILASDQCTSSGGGPVQCLYDNYTCTCQNLYQSASFKSAAVNSWMQTFDDILRVGNETGFLSQLPSAVVGLVNYYDGGNLQNIDTYNRMACDFLNGTFDEGGWPKCTVDGVGRESQWICEHVGGVWNNNNTTCNYNSPLIANYYSWNDRTGYSSSNNNGLNYPNFDPNSDAICYYAYYSKNSGKTQTCTSSGVSGYDQNNCEPNGGFWSSENGGECQCGGSTADDNTAGNGTYTAPAYLEINIDNGTYTGTCHMTATTQSQCDTDNNMGTTFCINQNAIDENSCTLASNTWNATHQVCVVGQYNGNGEGCKTAGYTWNGYWLQTNNGWCSSSDVQNGSRLAGECCTSNNVCKGECDMSTAKCVEASYSIDSDKNVQDINIHQEQ
jgi:hypothetical protein